ncbi:MAG: hypothetical protein JJU36_10150 [Phycisphaeraceae bacterium]|nr:hypothetical protein [Phycisphaeraceae bacterium]
MPQFGDGPWKEGRAGAASLCYRRLPAPRLERIAAHHAAVGIRATVACDRVSPPLRELAARHWDLARVASADGEPIIEALMEIDGRTERGVVLDAAQGSMAGEGDAATIAYRIEPTTGTIEPSGHLPDPLPAMIALSDPAALKKAMDAVVEQGLWAIWLIDDAVLDAMGLEAHAALLQWLGRHHGRIWCAPVHDIAAWVRAGG